MMALRRWIGADPGGAPQAVQRAVSGPPGHLMAGAVSSVLAVLMALELRAYTWLALFAGLLLPLVAVAALLLALQRAWPAARTWAAVWVALLAALPVAVLVAGRLYDIGLERVGIDVHNSAQVMMAEALLALLLFVMPLWMAQHRARTLHIAQLSQAVLASDLKALQAQIEPHFLYNTLANTRYLARHEPERAVEMLDHLIAYLRSALPDLRSPMSTLGRECELAGHYLELMAIRYGERLSVRIACADDVRDLALPPLMLMPLVENAVQHGVEPHAGAVTVTVQAQRADRSVLVAVRDNGAGVGSGQAVLGSGVGLRNVRQRLEALYGPAASLRLSMGADGWTSAELILPVAA